MGVPIVMGHKGVCSKHASSPNGLAASLPPPPRKQIGMPVRRPCYRETLSLLQVLKMKLFEKIWFLILTAYYTQSFVALITIHSAMPVELTVTVACLVSTFFFS